MTKWINVKERLPKENEWVIVGGKNIVDTGILTDKKFYHLDIKYCELAYVTHWMPLPNPPNNDE